VSELRCTAAAAAAGVMYHHLLGRIVAPRRCGLLLHTE